MSTGQLAQVDQILHWAEHGQLNAQQVERLEALEPLQPSRSARTAATKCVYRTVQQDGPLRMALAVRVGRSESGTKRSHAI